MTKIAFKSNTLKVIFLLTMVSFVVVQLLGCEKTQPTIVIKVMGQLSGIGSELAVSGRRGVELAVSEINEQGGILGRTVILENIDLNEPGITPKMAFESILKNNLESIVIGPFTSGNLLPSVPVIQGTEHKLLVVSPTVSADSLSGIDDNIIRLMPPTTSQSNLLIRWISEQKYTKNAIIYDSRNTGYTDKLVENFQKLYVEKIGTSPLVLPYDPSSGTETNQVLKRLIDEKLQTISVICSAEDTAHVISQYSKSGEPVQWLGAIWANTSELLKKGGLSIENMILVDAISLEQTHEKYMDFAKNYAARYGEKHSFSSVFSYESTMAIKDAIESSKSFKPNDVRKALTALGQFDGLQTTIQIDAYGDCSRELFLMRIANGQLVDAQLIK